MGLPCGKPFFVLDDFSKRKKGVEKVEKLDVLLAMQDEEFQEILQGDAVLDRLEKEKFNPEDEYFELMMIFSGEVEFCNLRFKTLTLGMWCYLFSIQNSFALSETPTKKDIDIFLFLLQKGYGGVSENLYSDSLDFCLKNQIPYEKATEFIYKIIFISFRALEMLPNIFSSEEKNRFNLEWMTFVLSTVCSSVNCSREFALYEMSLTEAFYYIVNDLKKNDTKNLIGRKNSDQINAEIYRRTLELGEEYFNKKYKK